MKMDWRQYSISLSTMIMKQRMLWDPSFIMMDGYKRKYPMTMVTNIHRPNYIFVQRESYHQHTYNIRVGRSQQWAIRTMSWLCRSFGYSWWENQYHLSYNMMVGMLTPINLYLINTMNICTYTTTVPSMMLMRCLDGKRMNDKKTNTFLSTLSSDE